MVLLRAEFSVERPWFNLGVVHIEFMADKVASGKFFPEHYS
jgi:hypothetical protein